MKIEQFYLIRDATLYDGDSYNELIFIDLIKKKSRNVM